MIECNFNEKENAEAFIQNNDWTKHIIFHYDTSNIIPADFLFDILMSKQIGHSFLTFNST